MHLSVLFRQVHFYCFYGVSCLAAALRPSRSDQVISKKSERRKITMEITIKINWRMVSVEVSGEVAE